MYWNRKIIGRSLIARGFFGLNDLERIGLATVFYKKKSEVDNLTSTQLVYLATMGINMDQMI